MARVVRIYPRSWHGRIAMRVEFYGCIARGMLDYGTLSGERKRSLWIYAYANVCYMTNQFSVSVHCNLPMGVASRKVPDQLITASSSQGGTCLPKYGRLSTAGYAWCSRHRNKKQWIQVISMLLRTLHMIIKNIAFTSSIFLSFSGRFWRFE